MKCRFCESAGITSRTDVVNSRKGKGGKEVWRRRLCTSCGEVFTTMETFSYDSLFVVKRTMVRKRFVYEKLFVSILNAISAGKGKDQGDDAMKAKHLTEEVIESLLTLHSKIIASKEIIHATHKVLEKEDAFYALRYAMYSTYRAKVLKKE